MDLVSWVLTFIIVGYILVLTVKTGAPLYRYYKARNRVVKVEGEISSSYGEEVTTRKGNRVSSFYPVYSCIVDDKKQTLNGAVRYPGERKDFIGQSAALFYDKETKELWSERDLPLMKKQIVIRLATVLMLTGMMVLTNVLL